MLHNFFFSYSFRYIYRTNWVPSFFFFVQSLAFCCRSTRTRSPAIQRQQKKTNDYAIGVAFYIDEVPSSDLMDAPSGRSPRCSFAFALSLLGTFFFQQIKKNISKYLLMDGNRRPKCTSRRFLFVIRFTSFVFILSLLSLFFHQTKRFVSKYLFTNNNRGLKCTNRQFLFVFLKSKRLCQ